VGFLNFLKKSKPASASSPDDAGLSIPPPPPFPQTAPQRDMPPSSLSELPDFKPFGQDIDAPPLGLPDVPEPKNQPDFRPPAPMPQSLQPSPEFLSPQELETNVHEQEYLEEPIIEEPKDEPKDEPEPELAFNAVSDLVIKQGTEPQKPVPAPLAKIDTDAEEIIKKRSGMVFMKAVKVALLTHEFSASAEKLRKMTVKIKHIEEQENATEEWRQQLEGLYRKLLSAEKSIFAGE